MNISRWVLSVIKLNISSLTIISLGHLKTLSLMLDSFNLEQNLFAWKCTLELELNEQSKTKTKIYVLYCQTRQELWKRQLKLYQMQNKSKEYKLFAHFSTDLNAFAAKNRKFA